MMVLSIIFMNIFLDSWFVFSISFRVLFSGHFSDFLDGFLNFFHVLAGIEFVRNKIHNYFQLFICHYMFSLPKSKVVNFCFLYKNNI